MKMILEGDCSEEDLKQLCKFLVKAWKGREEHLNVFILEGLEGKTLQETENFIREIFIKP